MSHEHADQDQGPEPIPNAEDLRGIAEDISSHYPPPRLGTELVLLEVNPHRAHAYWNIDVEDYRSAQARTGMERAPLVLRLYDITDGTPPERALTAFDVEIQGLQGHWYVDLWKDGHTHVADLGFRAADGRLVLLARSNPVSTPPAAESPNYHTLAVDTAQAGGLRVTDLVLDPNLSPENTDVETGAPLEGPPAIPAAASPLPAWPNAAPEAPPATVPFEPTAPVAPPPERMQDEVQAYFERAAEASAEVPVRPLWSGHQPAVAPGAGSASAQREVPAGWPSAEKLEQLVPASMAAAPAEPADRAEPASPAAPAIQPVPEAQPGASGPVGSSPMSLDSYVGLSSFENGRREVALEINVELHIHGRAKPGTELTLYGQPVPLRPDGSFSIRKPLPQGAVVLPLLAVDPPPPAPEG